MKWTSILLCLIFLTGCQKDKRQETRIRGQVLEKGTLKPVNRDSLCIQIYEGVPCGLPCIGDGTVEIASVPIVNGKYDYTFNATDDYHFMMVRNSVTGYIESESQFEIFPGEDIVRDIFLPTKIWTVWHFYDKGKTPGTNLIEVYEETWEQRLRGYLYPDSVMPPYTISFRTEAGGKHNFFVRIRGDSLFAQSSHLIETPYNDTLQIHIDF